MLTSPWRVSSFKRAAKHMLKGSNNSLPTNGKQLDPQGAKRKEQEASGSLWPDENFTATRLPGADALAFPYLSPLVWLKQPLSAGHTLNRYGNWAGSSGRGRTGNIGSEPSGYASSMVCSRQGIKLLWTSLSLSLKVMMRMLALKIVLRIS